MGWSSNPKFKISRRTLSFAEARKIYEDKDYWHRNHSGANIADAPPGRSHYWIEQRYEKNPTTEKQEECYSLLMYSTYIHTWWADGTYKSRYYDSNETRETLSAFGPVNVWSNSRCTFIDKDRFGIPPWREEGKNYPYGSGITVDPEGFVHDVADEKYVLKPGARVERSKLRDEIRDRTLTRIMLGEFDDVFARYESNVNKRFGRRETGWMAQVPEGQWVVGAFLQGLHHDEIEAVIKRTSFREGPTRETREGAMLAAIETMATEYINGCKDWYERAEVPYGSINVRDL